MRSPVLTGLKHWDMRSLSQWNNPIYLILCALSERVMNGEAEWRIIIRVLAHFLREWRRIPFNKNSFADMSHSSLTVKTLFDLNFSEPVFMYFVSVPDSQDEPL